MRRLPKIILTVFLLVSASALLAAQDTKPFSLTLIHVNDTHSKFDPTTVKLTLYLDEQLQAKPVYVEMGGFARVVDVINRLRKSEANPLVVHAGDMFQGTLYFTKFEGVADVALWNLAGLDAATLGNHEFDKGVPMLKNTLLSKVKFPIVDCNVDFSQEPALARIAPAPFVIKKMGKALVGLVGVSTPDTPFISSPGPTLSFEDPVPAVQKAVDALTARGVNKIVLLSHLGYAADIELASQVSGVDVIVGGHSHTLMGDWRAEGLSSFGQYPTLARDLSGNTVLIVQSWEWAKTVGDLRVNFDAKGLVSSWKAAPVAVVGSSWFRIYDAPDPEGQPKRVQFAVGKTGVDVGEYDGKNYAPVNDPERKALFAGYYDTLMMSLKSLPEIMLSPGDPKAAALIVKYSTEVQALKKQVAAQVGEDLKRGLNAGPGPLIADSMRAKTGSQIAITNAGGVRTDILQGPLTVAGVYELIPFGNTLVTLKLPGSDVVKVFEDAVDFALANYGKEFPANPITYVSGVTFDVNPSQPKGSRVANVKLLQEDGSLADLAPDETCTLVVNNFIAAGGDKYSTLGAAPGKYDTGFVDADVLLDWVRDKTLVNAEQRISIVK